MNILVDGVSITLIKEQVSKVEKAKLQRKKELKSFASVLKKTGFKSCGLRNDNVRCFNHENNGWYAEIINYGNYHECWLIGAGLKEQKSFPGGWSYGTPELLIEELQKHIEL